MKKSENNVIMFSSRSHLHNKQENILLNRALNTSFCPKCGVTCENGTWQWTTKSPLLSKQELCPACQRIENSDPAAFLTLNGQFFSNHRSQILRLISYLVEERMLERPLCRMMEVEKLSKNGVIISFTDTQSPLVIGKATVSIFDGELDVRNRGVTDIVRVRWDS